MGDWTIWLLSIGVPALGIIWLRFECGVEEREQHGLLLELEDTEARIAAIKATIREMRC